jgi:superfamily II DNA or RNA helicase
MSCAIVLDMPPVILRPYQHEARDALMAAHRDGVNRPATVLPTGTGKSTIIAVLAGRMHEATGQRGIILAHRVELIGQNAADLRSQNPGLRVGEVIGGTNDVGRDLISASQQTLASLKRREQITNVGFIIVDEAHHATSPTYRKILGHYGALVDAAVPAFDGGGQIPAFGFTATMTRSDKESLGDIWQQVVYSKSIAWAVNNGYLVRPYGKSVEVGDLDLSKVRSVGGDLSEGQLGDALEHSAAPELIARAYRDHAGARSGIVFAPTVHSAHVIADALRVEGFTAAVIWGDMPTEARKLALKQSASGDVQILVNCAVLTEGTNLPWISCIVVARPTKSTGLYIQMVGRGLRLDRGKTDCLILDVVGVSRKHALVSPVDLFGEEIRHRDKPLRELDDIEDFDNEPIELLDVDNLVIARQPFTGAYTVTDVDLFHSSNSLWQQTHAGWWFIDTGARYLAILPGEWIPGTWDVLELGYEAGQSRWLARGAASTGHAQASAEGLMGPRERWASERVVSWRDAKVRGAGGATRGELDALAKVEKASVRIDAPVAIVMEKRKTGAGA